MKIIDLPNILHFVGAGGISMSGLMICFKKLGFVVSGSDIRESDETIRLKNFGIKVSIGHDAKNVEGAGAVIKTSAISEDNVEIKRAREVQIPVFERGEILAALSKNYETVVAVAGSHGKSTVTSMLSKIMLDSKMQPTCHIGAVFPEIDGSVILNDGKIFITEACEYKNNFLSLAPTITIITGIELDHPDFYNNLIEIEESFIKLAEKTSDTIITTPKVKKILKNTERVVTCGITSDCDYQATKINNISGGFSYAITKQGFCLGRITLNKLGLFNLFNSLFAYAAADILGVDFFTIEQSLFDYKGIKRRQEKLRDDYITIYSDYAHHPTQIKELINAIRPKAKRIIAVFQPHTYSRTKSLYDDFCNVFLPCDYVILTPVYSARESYDYLGSSEKLYGNLNSKMKSYANNKEEVFSILNSYVEKGDTILFLGAGDIDVAAREFAANYK